MSHSSLETILQELQQKNIVFLREFYPTLFLQLQMHNNEPSNKHLVFENNFLNIENEQTNSYQYAIDPFIEADFKTANIAQCAYFDTLHYNLLKCFDNNEIDAYAMINELIPLQSKNKQTLTMKKFIFVGTLLAIHLPSMHQALKSEAYLIIEPSIEIFKLSLFTCDYSALSSTAQLFFCIGDTNLSTVLTEFLNYRPWHNKKLFYDIIHTDYISLLENLHLLITTNQSFIYPFSQYLLSLKRGLHYHYQKFDFLTIKKQANFLKNTPIMIISAGPSLSTYEQFIIQNYKKCLVVVIAATLKKMQSLKIVPDLIISIDAGENSVLRQLDEVDPKYYYQSLWICSQKTHPKVIQHLNKNKCIFIQDSLEIFDFLGVNTGVTVSDVALSILLQLGATTIYMVGLDGAYSNSGQSHDLSHYQKKIDFMNNPNIITTKGNNPNNPIVFTSKLFIEMKKHIEILLKNHPQVNVFNLSDGAYFEGTRPYTHFLTPNINCNKLKLQQSIAQLISPSLLSATIKELVINNLIFLNLFKENLHLPTNIFGLYKFIEDYHSFCISKEIFKQYFLTILPYYDDSQAIQDTIQQQIKHLINDLFAIFTKDFQ